MSKASVASVGETSAGDKALKRVVICIGHVIVGLLSSHAAWAQDGSSPTPEQSERGPTDAPACTSSSCSLSSTSSCSSCSSSSCRSGSCRGSCGTCRDAKPKLSLSVTGLRVSSTRIADAQSVSNSFGLAFAGGVDSYALDGTTHGSLQWV